MKDLKITKENIKFSNFDYRVDVEYYGTFLMTGNYCVAKFDAKENAELTADAFNTAQKCNLLPSELLEQRDELLKMTVKLREWYEENQAETLKDYTPVCFSEALSLIKSIKK